MHLHIKFHNLALTQVSSYIKLPEWIAKKKAVINLKNKDEECFKRDVIVVLYHEDIKHHLERISLLQHYEGQYNWKRLEFLLAILKIGIKCEKNNPGIQRYIHSLQIRA